MDKVESNREHEVLSSDSTIAFDIVDSRKSSYSSFLRVVTGVGLFLKMIAAKVENCLEELKLTENHLILEPWLVSGKRNSEKRDDEIFIPSPSVWSFLTKSKLSRAATQSKHQSPRKSQVYHLDFKFFKKQ